MGLDMGLIHANREELEGWNNLLPSEQRVTESPWKEVGTWRKANQIRKWFIDGHDCNPQEECGFEVTKEELELLKDTCERVLDNHDLAEELLPTSTGFFFGSQEYNEWYYADLADTIAICAFALNFIDWEKEVVEYWEWW